MITRRVGARRIEVSNPDKMLFPADKITKLELIDYYAQIAPIMLPHMRDRPITMQRFPNGIAEPGFYQKEVPDYFPAWIPRVDVCVEREGAEQPQVMVNNAATLVYVAEQDCITFHTWLSRKDKLYYPDRLIFDLDPPGDRFDLVRDAAWMLREVLQQVGLEPFIMTTGSRGMHVTTPIQRTVDFTRAQAFARLIADELARRDPERFTTRWSKSARGDRLFLDYKRNTYAQHGVCPYSVRAKSGAPVATPLSWDELSDKKLSSQSYNLRNVFRRLEHSGDPWQQIGKHARALDKAEQRLDEVLA